jgi:hypothetical protein
VKSKKETGTVSLLSLSVVSPTRARSLDPKKKKKRRRAADLSLSVCVVLHKLFSFF